MIDFHSHLIPGVDDGAETLDQTRAALSAMREQGVERIVTTPHLSGALTQKKPELETQLAVFDRAWDEVQQLARVEFPELVVERGVELMLDTPAPDPSDPRVRLAGTPFVLVEFPFMSVPPNPTQVLFEMKVGGFRPILAHPERYRNFSNVEDADEWRSVGALLQVNCGSLLGRYGEKAERLGWELLERGWVSFVGSDFHARGSLHIAGCRALLEEHAGKEIASLLTNENARRMLSGDEPGPAPPFKRQRSIWSKLLGRRS